MAETVEMEQIRGLDIDKTVKGFSEVEYIFKNDCTVSSTTADSIRWYQETAGDLSATTPAAVANISPLSTFPTLEKSWTRNTSYIRKYAAEGFISMEDIKSADIDVLVRSLRALTRAVTKQVDTRIWNVITEDGAATNINRVNASGAWNGGTACNPIHDILEAKRRISTNDYNPEGASLYISPTSYEYLINWIITSKGSSIPNFSSEKIKTGTVLSILGVNIKVSNNVSWGSAGSGAAVLIIPQQSCTWKSYSDITTKAIEEPGIGTKLRVWELGEGLLTDPKSVAFIPGTEITSSF